MKLIRLFIITTTVFLTACASSEKPHYILTDSELHQYEGGDKLNYNVLSLLNNAEFTGILSYNFESTTLLTPNNNTLDTLLRKTEVIGDINFIFATPYFTQSENGDLTLQAYSESGQTYWIAENDDSETGEIFYTSPLSDLTGQITINQILHACDNSSCDESGSTNIRLTALGVETIETEYAKFDAYKFALEWTADIHVNDETATIKNYSLIGFQWLYPALGMVKFDYTLDSSSLNTQFGSNSLFGTLSNTNINIPATNKKTP